MLIRPQEIDEAARRRLVKRLYIPLPDAGAREQIMHSLLLQQKCSLSEQEIKHIVQRTHGMLHGIFRSAQQNFISFNENFEWDLGI